MPDPVNISKIQLPNGGVYNIKDDISGYTDTTIIMDEPTYTLFITSSIINADEREY